MIDTTIDFNFGVENEKKLLETLSKKHNNLTLTSKYCLYDFMNDTTLIELKILKTYMKILSICLQVV